MATITKKENLEFATIASAVKYVTNLRGRNHFMVKVEAFLPTGDGKGFPGMTFLTVSRADFIEVIKGMGTILVDDRGGKIVLRVEPSEYENDRSCVSFY